MVTKFEVEKDQEVLLKGSDLRVLSQSLLKNNRRMITVKGNHSSESLQEALKLTKPAKNVQVFHACTLLSHSNVGQICFFETEEAMNEFLKTELDSTVADYWIE